MPADSTRLASRSTTVLVLAAAHALVLWSFWRVEVPLPPELETFTSVLFWLPPPEHAGSAGPAHPPRVTSLQALRAPQLMREPAPDSDTTIALPANPAPTIDWSAALPGAAAAALEKEKRVAAQLDAVTRKYAVPDDPRDPHPGPGSSFRWYEAGIHRIDTRAFIPGLWLNDHCVLIAFVIPACRIGHIEVHGDLFEGAAAVHDEKLATPRPNDVP